MLSQRKQLVKQNREQRRQLRAALENLTDPTLLDRIEQGEKA